MREKVCKSWCLIKKTHSLFVCKKKKIEGKKSGMKLALIYGDKKINKEEY